ncbi:MAG: S8/S53 family peptidase, partial [Saprospiraceae bacterium]
MKRSTLLLLAALLFIVHSCRKQDPATASEILGKPDPTTLDQFIRAKLETEGQFLWAWASDEQVWTALSNGDFVLSVGYQPVGEKDVADRLHLLNIQAPAWQTARQSILDLILTSERTTDPGLTEAKLLAFPENGVLPVFDVYIKNPSTITALRQSGLVRYAEPIGYEPFKVNQNADRSGSGCGNNVPQTGLVAGSDYTNITPGCKQSWNHPFHKVTEAWNNSTGSGVTVAIIDTGCSDDQENLGDDFNQGWSSGRTIEKYVTLPQATNIWGQLIGSPETPNDLCGHGTSMQGACAAPRGTDGNSTGIAYNANMVTIRAAADVFLDESRETVGVSNAFIQAGNDGNVRIISMSMGRLTSASQISDAVKYAYNKGKLIFCAAGTSFWWSSWFVGVIFPASMAEAVAVTGVKDNLSSACADCHTGSKVDFVLVMEKNSNGHHATTLADYGDDPGTVGGSSVATSSTAGIAALVWSKYPSWT